MDIDEKIKIIKETAPINCDAGLIITNVELLEMLDMIEELNKQVEAIKRVIRHN